MLTQELLKERLEYDPETGVFTRVLRVRGKCKTYTREKAGSVNNSGYLIISVGNVAYRAHRLAWLYVYGEFPKKHLDHINRDRLDNRINNLREVTRAQNAWNTGARLCNTSGYTGVSWHNKARKWAANIRVHMRKKCLGYFDSPEAAHAAYVAAKEKLHIID